MSRYAFFWFYLFIAVVNLPFAVGGHALNAFIAGFHLCAAVYEFADVHRGEK